MQFSAHRDALLAALAPSVDLTVKNSSAPVLAYVLIEVDKHGTVSATGTNLLATMTRTVQGAETRPGSVCAPGRDLDKILRLMPAGDVRLSAAVNSDITLESLVPRKKVRVQLRGLHAIDFPKLDKVDLDGCKPAVMRVADLRALADAVLYAASKDAHRTHLGVMHIEREAGGLLHAVTTDGHRLCHASAQVPFPATSTAGTGIPARSMQSLLDALPEEGSVALQLAPGYLVAVCGPLRATLKLVADPFPAWRNIIPAEFTHTCTIARTDVALLLARAETLAAAKTGSTGFTFSAKEGGELAVSVDNPDQGAMKDSVAEGVAVSGDEIRLSLNARYIDEAIQHLQGEQVMFGMRGKLEVVHLSTGGTHDNDFRAIALVMPMAN